MKLPKKIKIANHVYTIEEWEPDLALATGCFGLCQNNELNIKISTDYSQSQIKETLLHEVLHAINWTYHIEEGDCEERTVTAMASALSQVFQDNKEFREFLL